MIKNIGKKFVQGFVLFLALHQIIVLWISIDAGKYMPVSESMIRVYGSTLDAIVIYSLADAILGSILIGSSVIYTALDWSLNKQTLTHYGIILATVLIYNQVIATSNTLLSIIINVTLIYSVIWLYLYKKMQRDVKILNDSQIQRYNRHDQLS